MSTKRLHDLNPTLRELARTNYNESPITDVDQIRIIKEWIEKSPHLKASTDPQLILAFLRRCRFSLEETKRRIDDYYALKNAFPEVLNERERCTDLMEFYRSGIHIVHNKPVTPDGSVLMISLYCKIDSKKSNPRLAFKLLIMLFEFTAHKKVEDLLEYIRRDAVTIEYGGVNGHISEAVEFFKQTLLAYKKHFLEDVHFDTNEDLRDGRKKEWELVGVKWCERIFSKTGTGLENVTNF